MDDPCLASRSVDDWIRPDCIHSLGHSALNRRSLGSLSEAILLLSKDRSHMSHSSSARSISPLSLARPVVSSGLGSSATASASASLLLLVPVLLSTESAQRVRLVVSSSLS